MAAYDERAWVALGAVIIFMGCGLIEDIPGDKTVYREFGILST
jgi:hypothetical protein